MGQKTGAADWSATRTLSGFRLGSLPIAPEAVMVEAVRWTFGDDAAVLHDHDTVGGFEDLVQDMRNEDDGSALAMKRRTMVEHLTARLASSDDVGSSRITAARGCGIGKASAISTICVRAIEDSTVRPL